MIEQNKISDIINVVTRENLIPGYIFKRKALYMAVSYNKLWKILIDKKMKKVDLRDQAGLTTNVLAKLGKDEHVSTQSLEKICKTLDCEINDIIEFTEE